MHSNKIDIFFSCSFRPQDKPVNDLVAAICRALDLEPTNVSTAYVSTPPNVAIAKIEAAQALIAVCTRRDELKVGGHLMPPAVHDEISFAFGRGTPVLMFVEEGVSLEGFKGNFGTHHLFDRTTLTDPESIQKLVEAIHGLKLEVLGPHQAGASHGITEAHAEYLYHMIELRAVGSDFVWEYSTTKKLVYTTPSKRAYPLSFWATTSVIIPDDAKPIEWDLTLLDSSRGITLDTTVEKETPTCVEAVVRLAPPAEEGDYVEYSTTARSRHLNPVWLEEVPAGPVIHLNNGDYACGDGLVFIHRTKHAVLEFRFPRECGLLPREVVPFVGSYTSAVDYEVESELKRATVKTDNFGGNVVVRMEVESPLPGHMYGVVWNPKPRPVPAPTEAISADAANSE